MADIKTEVKEKNTIADKVNLYHKLILNAQKNGAVNLVARYQTALKNILISKQNAK